MLRDDGDRLFMRCRQACDAMSPEEMIAGTGRSVMLGSHAWLILLTAAIASLLTISIESMRDAKYEAALARTAEAQVREGQRLTAFQETLLKQAREYKARAKERSRGRTERIEHALKAGEVIDAMAILANVADEMEEHTLTDAELVGAFRRAYDRVAATAVASTQPQSTTQEANHAEQLDP